MKGFFRAHHFRNEIPSKFINALGMQTCIDKQLYENLTLNIQRLPADIHKMKYDHSFHPIHLNCQPIEIINFTQQICSYYKLCIIGLYTVSDINGTLGKIYSRRKTSMHIIILK